MGGRGHTVAPPCGGPPQCAGARLLAHPARSFPSTSSRRLVGCPVPDAALGTVRPGLENQGGRQTPCCRPHFPLRVPVLQSLNWWSAHVSKLLKIPKRDSYYRKGQTQRPLRCHTPSGSTRPVRGPRAALFLSLLLRNCSPPRLQRPSSHQTQTWLGLPSSSAALALPATSFCGGPRCRTEDI